MLIGDEQGQDNKFVSFKGRRYDPHVAVPCLNIVLSGGMEVLATEHHLSSDINQGSNPILMSGVMVSFGIKNNSPNNNVIVGVQLSNDNVYWIDDHPPYMTEVILTPFNMIVLNTQGYMKYARIIYKSSVAGKSADIDIQAVIKK